MLFILFYNLSIYYYFIVINFLNIYLVYLFCIVIQFCIHYILTHYAMYKVVDQIV